MPNPMAHPDGPGSQATPEAPVPVSSPVGADHLRAYIVEMHEDRPKGGMWHNGPNAAWVTVTHIPTMISARAFDLSHHAAKMAAQACCEMMVEQSRLLKCQFPERLSDSDAGLAEDGASRLNREAAAARAEGIAQHVSEAPNGD